MKRFLLLASLVGSAIAGFLWWKRKEVARANEIARDPWPSVIEETRTYVPPGGAGGASD